VPDSGGQPLIPGGYPGITRLEGLGAHQAGPCPAGSRGCAPVPDVPLAPWATWPGRRMARRFRDPEIIAEDPAVAEHLGDWGCPKFPRKPDVPRKWEQRDWCAAWDRIRPAARARGARPAPLDVPAGRTAPARRPHGARTAPAAAGSGSPAGLPVNGTRSTGHDLRDTIYGTRSGWPHGHRPRPFSLSSKGPLSASMAARPRRASTAAIVLFPAPGQPVIITALIGVYRRPAVPARSPRRSRAPACLVHLPEHPHRERRLSRMARRRSSPWPSRRPSWPARTPAGR
jgi:hypothetical protein